MPERFVCTLVQKGAIQILFLTFPFSFYWPTIAKVRPKVRVRVRVSKVRYRVRVRARV